MKSNKLSKKLFIIILSILISLSSTASYCNDTTSSSENSSEVIVETQDNVESDKASVQKTKLNLHSEAAILIDSKTGTVLYGKNENDKMNPASTTKVLTAILTIENGNLNDMTTVSAKAIAPIPSGYSTAYLTEGEEISVLNLLKALLIYSANDAGNVLAEYVSGSMESFVDMMNQKATEIGCTNSHFVNTNGVHNENHYSTASDLAKISRYCMQNETFRQLVSMKSCTIPATNKSKERVYANTNKNLLTSSEYYREDCIGIKTGFTTPARHCLLSSCKKDDMELIAVILHAQTAADRYSDVDTLYSFGYKNYKILVPEEEKNIEETSDENINTEQINAEASSAKSPVENLMDNNNLITILIALLILVFLILISLIIISKKLKNNRYERKH